MGPFIPCHFPIKRAGDGIRTREYQLGRLTPYHLATPASTSFYRAAYLGSSKLDRDPLLHYNPPLPVLL